jgi:hypothetical protein
MLISGKQLKNSSIGLDKIVNLDEGKIIIGQDGAAASAQAISGDITLAANGAVALGAVVDSTKLAANFLQTQATYAGVLQTDDDKISSSSLVKSYVDGAIAAIPGTTVDYAALDASSSISTDLTAGGLSNTVPSSDAVKSYVDQNIQGLDVKEAVKLTLTGSSVTGAITSISSGIIELSSSYPNLIDGVSVSLNDRVLVNTPESGFEKYNGIYTVSTLWVDGVSNLRLTRATDADNTPGNEVSNGMFCAVLYGTYAGTSWILRVASAITLDTTALTFVQFASASQLTIKANGGLTNSGSNELAIDITNLTAFAGSVALTTDLLVINDGAASGGERKITVSDLIANVGGDGLTVTSGVIAVDGSIVQTVSYSSSTTSGNAAKISSVAFSSAPNGNVQVFVNGIAQNVSYSTTSGDGDCFFAASSATAQSSARASGSILASDVLFWNGTTAGFNIESGDEIKLVYMPK